MKLPLTPPTSGLLAVTPLILVAVALMTRNAFQLVPARKPLIRDQRERSGRPLVRNAASP